MTIIRAVLASLFLALSACASSGQSASEIRIFNPDLRQAFEDLPGTMSAQRTSLVLPTGATISTCREYLQHADRGDREQPDQMLALQDYLICDSVSLLQRAQATPLAPIDAGHALATRLDFRTFPSSMGPRTNAQAFSFETLAAEQLVIEAHSATLESDSWYLRIERVAAADFDGDGREDWLVWIGDDSTNGTYQSFQALLVHDVTEAGFLAGEPIR